jgi:hypothetical protein
MNYCGFKGSKVTENIKYVTQILWRKTKIFIGFGKNWELYCYPNLKITDIHNIRQGYNK